jgi:SAM-dependent methyltransferase
MMERLRAMASLLEPLRPLSERTLLEIGAAMGSNVPYLMDLGFRPERILINDVVPEKIEQARSWLPAGVRAVPGDAAALPETETFDVVFAATVFTSIGTYVQRQQVAEKMWRLTAPGGGVLLYDFTWNNPWNRGVRKLTLRDVRRLFPDATVMRHLRVTLAPPLARHVSLPLYRLLSRLAPLRTHVVCWLGKATSARYRPLCI